MQRSVQIRGNSIDVTASSAAVAVSVGADVARVVIADNAVTGAGSDSACVSMQGANSSTRVVRNNECW